MTDAVTSDVPLPSCVLPRSVFTVQLTALGQSGWEERRFSVKYSSLSGPLCLSGWDVVGHCSVCRSTV
jgi:hypothetical protein